MVLNYVSAPRRRGSFEVKMSVIEAIHAEERLTRIMYRIQGITYTRLRQVVADLVNIGMVVTQQVEGDCRTRVVYRLTEQGELVLRSWSNLKDVMP